MQNGSFRGILPSHDLSDSIDETKSAQEKQGTQNMQY